MTSVNPLDGREIWSFCHKLLFLKKFVSHNSKVGKIIVRVYQLKMSAEYDYGHMLLENIWRYIWRIRIMFPEILT